LRFKPPFEILNADFMLNLGLADSDCNRRLSAAHLVDPIVLPKHTQALSHSFVKRVRRDFNDMLNSARVAVRYPALAKTHHPMAYQIRRLFASAVIASFA
jgi:hypothetical protein